MIEKAYASRKNAGSSAAQEGSALVTVIIFSLIATIMAISLLSAAGSQARVANAQLDLEKALFVAQAGVEMAANYIESRMGYLPDTYSGSGTAGEGTYTYTISKNGWRAYTVESVGTVKGTQRRVSIDRVYQPSFAKYALWMADNGKIYFIGGEEFFGHVHANDKMWFDEVDGLGAMFHAECTSGADSYGGSLAGTVFDMGFQLNAQEGQLASVNFPQLNSLAGEFGLVLDGETTITFEDSFMKITNDRKGWNDELVPIGPDQIVYVQNSSSGDSSTQKGQVNLQGGEVDGKVTIVSDSDILINDHIRYMNNPLDGESDDALGLISRDDVWVTPSAPDNLDLHAAILATGQQGDDHGSFGVLDYNHGDPRGSLNVVGSIVQDERGAVGTFNKNGPHSGYFKNYAFDTRFATQAPPYYPVVDDKLKYEGWSEGPVNE